MPWGQGRGEVFRVAGCWFLAVAGLQLCRFYLEARDFCRAIFSLENVRARDMTRLTRLERAD